MSIFNVQFAAWFQYYQDIRKKMGYSTEKDQQAAYLLSNMIKNKALNPQVLEKKIYGKEILVVGAGPDLELRTKFIKKHRSIRIAADGAVRFLIENNIIPDIVVTDLDGDSKFLLKAEKLGSIMVVHAHADNMTLIEKLVPKFKKLVGTTQVMPVGRVHNFGGFTDGDRCVFLADEFGAKQIILVGMSFDDEIGKYSKPVILDRRIKRQKMEIAKRLLQMLAKQSRSALYDLSSKPIPGFRQYAI